MSWYFFQGQNLLIDVTFPLMSSFGVYAALVFVNYVREQLDRQRIRSAFGQYLSPTWSSSLRRIPKSWCSGAKSAR